MKVYFVRHGETTYNASNVFQPLDASLSELGLKQAKFVAERFTSIPIDVILSSPLLRTQQTANEINKTLNKGIVWIDELKEFRRPTEFINKNPSSKEVSDVKKLFKENQHDSNWHYSDEENFFDVKKRALKLIEIINSRSEKNILAVTHGEFLRMVIGVMYLGENITVDEYAKLQKFLKTINTGITVVVKEDDKWKLLTWNDHAHLG